jgi:hypothetical protein
MSLSRGYSVVREADEMRIAQRFSAGSKVMA